MTGFVLRRLLSLLGVLLVLSLAVFVIQTVLPADPVIATGLVRLAEAAKQLSAPVRGGASAPAKAIVHGTGGLAMQTNCVFTLEV